MPVPTGSSGSVHPVARTRQIKLRTARPGPTVPNEVHRFARIFGSPTQSSGSVGSCLSIAPCQYPLDCRIADLRNRQFACGRPIPATPRTPSVQCSLLIPSELESEVTALVHPGVAPESRPSGEPGQQSAKWSDRSCLQCDPFFEAFCVSQGSPGNEDETASQNAIHGNPLLACCARLAARFPIRMPNWLRTLNHHQRATRQESERNAHQCETKDVHRCDPLSVGDQWFHDHARIS